MDLQKSPSKKSKLSLTKMKGSSSPTKKSAAIAPIQTPMEEPLDLVEMTQDVEYDDIGNILDAMKALKKQIKSVKTTQIRSMKLIEKYFETIDQSGLLEVLQEQPNEVGPSSSMMLDEGMETSGEDNLIIAKKEAISQSARKLRAALRALQQAQEVQRLYTARAWEQFGLAHTTTNYEVKQP